LYLRRGILASLRSGRYKGANLSKRAGFQSSHQGILARKDLRQRFVHRDGCHLSGFFSGNGYVAPQRAPLSPSRRLVAARYGARRVVPLYGSGRSIRQFGWECFVTQLDSGGALT
jgi:hypothetical protein